MVTSVNKMRTLLLCTAFILSTTLPITANSTIISFHFTGNIVVENPNVTPPSSIIYNNGLPITPIAANLNYDTVNGVGSSDLSITMPDFLGNPATFHNINLAYDGSSSIIRGSILIDWAGNFDMPMHIEWDATGLLNAIDVGLDVGDVISGSILTKASGGQFNVSSATPYSDPLLQAVFYTPLEGPAPLAATGNSLGLGYDIDGNYLPALDPLAYPNGNVTPFDGIRGLANIGSGNSLTVVSISSVPVPAAVWLFGSGLLGLIGMAKRRKQS